MPPCRGTSAANAKLGRFPRASRELRQELLVAQPGGDAPVQQPADAPQDLAPSADSHDFAPENDSRTKK